MNKQNLHIIGKASRITFGSVPRPVVESYRSQGFYTLGKASQVTLGYVMGKAIEGGATRALPFIKGS